MSCNCFWGKSPVTLKMSFTDKLQASACHCNARFTVEENHRRFSIVSKNVNDVNKYKVDKWLYNDNTHKKCDYFFEYKRTLGQKKTNIDTCIFVELKGIDITHAVEQIDETIRKFKEAKYFQSVNVSKVIAAIVFSHYPSNNSSFRCAVEKLRKNHKDLHVHVEHKANSLDFQP